MANQPNIDRTSKPPRGMKGRAISSKKAKELATTINCCTNCAANEVCDIDVLITECYYFMPR